MRLIPIILAAALPGWGADPITAEQAVQKALASHGSVEAGVAALNAAGSRIAAAKGARLPQVRYTENWTRSNNQVFVFGSLLTQKQFTAANFDVTKLNDPGFLNNFQSQVVVDQTLFDNGQRKARIAAAEIGREVGAEENRRTEMDVIAAVLNAYYGAVLAREGVNVAAEAVKSAEADERRALTRREAGVTTDADVLSIRVHLAGMREREIRRKADLELALARLNQSMGLPLESSFDLTTPLSPLDLPKAASADAEKDAAASRPEIRQVRLAERIGEEQAKAARAARLPEFYLRAGFEADRQRFVTRGGANWLASAGLRWNLFDGFADRARVEEARYEVDRLRAQARVAESGVKLEARRAWLDLESAGQRIQVARAAVAMAEENLRIVKNRYDAGLTEVTELLRSETALLETRTRVLEAVRDQRLAAVALEAARGRLTKDSEVVTR